MDIYHHGNQNWYNPVIIKFIVREINRAHTHTYTHRTITISIVINNYIDSLYLVQSLSKKPRFNPAKPVFLRSFEGGACKSKSMAPSTNPKVGVSTGLSLFCLRICFC